ncbi:class I SAM-dependent methyltransferase [Flammeovirga sp. SubArs3]|uniref:class I SAM-dependent methyltransferase n=1 Tax=Flammeovirga sp. SubArs3 TaxID=2995316 RepID=UPI00248CAD7E|nr:class I SAM-dependent methyltransferase [Flammeovirga sp. SubArs3]
MTELELIMDLFKHLDRQGPGSKKETLKALEYLNIPTHKKLEIADLGCGSGDHSIPLAQKLDANIISVDLSTEFLEVLNENAKKEGVQEKIKTLEVSMDDLPFEKDQFDIIWSEGAIYNIGFENGIKNWKDYIKTKGYLVVSEINWLTNSRPKEVEDYWKQAYPEINTVGHKVRVLEENGFSLMGFFNFGEDSWLDTYYTPIEKSFPDFLERHHHSELAQQIVKGNQDEIDFYKKYKEYYTYGFYIAQKD